MESIEYRQLQTPCFILDCTEFKRSVFGFKKALDSNFKRNILSYSVKTNSLPSALSEVKELGVYAEVVSYDEYDLALACGFSRNRIIYNGPLKSKSTFLEAVTAGAIVNIEAKRELDWLRELPDNGNYSVGLRLNVNISKVSPEDADGDNDNSRFGFSDETDDFDNAVRFISGLANVKIAGLHIHRTSHSRSLRFYENSLQFACDTIKKYNLNLDYLDIGGGYFGIFPNKPTYQEYCDAFCEVLKRNGLHNLCVVVEPGNALIASSFSFLSEVIDVKHVEKDVWFITTDGSRNDLDPFFKKTSYLSDIHYSKDNEIVPVQIVGGCTCLEYDRMFTLLDKPLCTVGDRITYNNVGAYTMCLSPLFIRYIPNVYLKKNGEYSLIRERWTAKEYIIKSKL